MEGRYNIAVLQPAKAGRAPVAASPTELVLRTGFGLAVILGAYRESWLTLLGPPHAALVGLALAVLLATATALLSSRPQPDIHDRYTDYILGLPMLAAAVGILVILPSRLSVFFWFWRMDLLSIPLFVAGTIVLLFGVRALWRFRLAIIALLLVWLLQSDRIESFPTLIALLAGIGAFAYVLTRSRGRRSKNASRAVVGRPLFAAAVVLLMAIGVGLASWQLGQFSALFIGDGMPRLAATTSKTALPGWNAHYLSAYPWIQRYAGADARWNRYAYTDRQGSVVLLDVIASDRREPIADAPLATFYRLHDYRLTAQQDLPLGDGVIGQALTYLDPAGDSWNAISWEWPVRSGSGVRYERIVLTALRNDAGTPGTLARFSRALIEERAQ